jgi:hypothetical protein
MIVQICAFKGFSKDRENYYTFLVRVDLLRKVPDGRYTLGWRTDHLYSGFTWVSEEAR